MSKFKIGDKVRLKGTKHDGEWEEYFGKYGVKKGDIATIKYVEKGPGKIYYFVEIYKKGSDNSGHLIKEDITSMNLSMKELLE
jgi:hypothetical protein